jgi:hypothetical protein
LALVGDCKNEITRASKTVNTDRCFSMSWFILNNRSDNVKHRYIRLVYCMEKWVMSILLYTNTIYFIQNTLYYAYAD